MIVFLGYIDTPDEMLPGGKRRSVYGLDSEADVANLPVNSGLVLPSGSTTAPPAPWSYAIVRGEDALVLGTDGEWKPM